MTTLNPHNTFGKGHAARAVNGGNDAYFTKASVATHCMQQLKTLLRKWRISKPLFLEPAAGAGAWLDALPKNAQFVAYDIAPADPRVEQGDFYKMTLPTGAVVIGNPPFGFAAKEAVGFFNHAAQLQSKVIAFIVPRTFKKQSIQNKLDRNYHLEFELDLEDNSFLVNGISHNVPCCFQIWRRKKTTRTIVEYTIDNPWFEFTTPARASFAVRRVGGQAGRVLNGTDHSVSSTYFIRPKIDERELLKAFYAIDLAIVDQTAGVRSISKRELVSLIAGQFNQGQQQEAA